MTNKTKKELQAEILLLRQELADIKTKFSQLSEKCKSLEQIEKSSSFLCHKCSKNFQTNEALKNHMRNHQDKKESVKCFECDLEFNEEWKMLAHKKNRTNVKCDKCDKIFRCQVIKEKHMSISHDDKIVYCHYFNNGKKCPYENKCIFIHEDSEICKYGIKCERIFCMFKHDNENIDNIAIHYSDANATFENPYLKEPFECDFCGDFITTIKKEFEEHLDEEKRFCMYCKKDYDCVYYLKEHIESDHKELI